MKSIKFVDYVLMIKRCTNVSAKIFHCMLSTKSHRLLKENMPLF